MQQWLAEAPANIALIKYMGKKNSETRIPMHPSLSFTLNHLRSYVSMESSVGEQDVWEPLELPGVDTIIALSSAEQQRFLGHLAFLKQEFSYTGTFIVRSSNNFPLSTGLASSASSFAALTKCAVLALSELTHQDLPSIAAQAKLSRHGSGSSCRSFFSPWALWEEEEVRGLDLPYDTLIHQVILVSHTPKTVSSSEAHARVITSPLYPLRVKQAMHHLEQLLSALGSKNWANAYAICWEEFQAMHQLFTSCSQPFSYMTETTRELLATLQAHWQATGDGPLITMDAGPNIHLLYRPDQSEEARLFKQNVLIGNFDVL